MDSVKTEYEDSELTSRVIGAAMRVHTGLGCGFPEVIYQRAFAKELTKSAIPFSREFELPIFYDGDSIGSRKVDFLIEERVSVELKAVVRLEDVHLAQAKNYIEAFDLRVGLLINFGAKSLEFKRLINSKAPPLKVHQWNQQNQRNPGRV
jgi:GxxExxY protein